MSIENYADWIAARIRTAWCSTTDKTVIGVDQGLKKLQTEVSETSLVGHKIMLIGNGGSAAIASHIANDWSKNGGIRSIALNDPAALTCLANDFGYEEVFAKQIEMQASAGDVLIAISSSGESRNIRSAVKAALDKHCLVATFSGFDPANPLRAMGDLNFYINSRQYGCVEIAHLTLLHAVIDLGLTKETAK